MKILSLIFATLLLAGCTDNKEANAGMAAPAAPAAPDGSKPAYATERAVPASTPFQPSDEACETDALKAIRDKTAREDMAAACIRRGTFKPTPKTRTF
jgi:entry exclusion lipoprotein TrbK